ncbi:putative Mg2+ transporter-C (MgtC) family protein [Elusimicrobium simillimum]|uniref:MgtC/SapB family protein n=1 Tax=Elusimicrobium simillimum TaxID=3143438 RepID=UPI003C6F9023
MTEMVFIERLLISLALGGLIGLERQYNDKPAGFATNSLICIGSTLFTLVSLKAAGLGADPARIAAQIITGVGFLGAGAIIRDGVKISGLTTAAGVWLVAAVGMAVGFGDYIIASTAAALVLTVQLVLRKTLRLLDHVKRYETLNVVCEPNWKVIDKISHTMEKHGVEILSRKVLKENGYFHASMVATFTGKEFERITKELFEMPEVKDLTR